MAATFAKTGLAACVHLGRGVSIIELALPNAAKAAKPGHLISLQRLNPAGEATSACVVLPVFGVSPVAGARAEKLQVLVPRKHADLIAPLWPGQDVQFGAFALSGQAWDLDFAGFDALLLVGENESAAHLVMLAQHLASGKAHELTLLAGAETREAMPWFKLLSFLSDAGVSLMPAAPDGSFGHRGEVFDPLVSELEAGLARDKRIGVIAAGSLAFVHRAAELARDRGTLCYVLPTDRFGCGKGLCGSCELPTQDGGALRVCSSLALVSAQEVDWPKFSLS